MKALASAGVKGASDVVPLLDTGQAVRTDRDLMDMKKVMSRNPEGIAATFSMNNLYQHLPLFQAYVPRPSQGGRFLRPGLYRSCDG